jgi:hypothetical protein
MATRIDMLQELTVLCRRHPYIALGVISWLCARDDLEDLQRALDHAHELQREWVPMDGHLALVEERWGAARRST